MIFLYGFNLHPLFHGKGDDLRSNIFCVSVHLGLTLFDWMKDASFTNVGCQKRLLNIQKIVLKACTALNYLHQLGYFHSDISLKNIMWNP